MGVFGEVSGGQQDPLEERAKRLASLAWLSSSTFYSDHATDTIRAALKEGMSSE